MMSASSFRVNAIVRSDGTDWWCLNSAASPQIRAALEEEAYETIAIDLSAAQTALDLFLQIITALPCNPSYDHKVINRSASEDCLWGGLHSQNSLAVLLHNAELLVNEHINILLLIYGDIASVVGKKMYKHKGWRKKVKIFAFGEGDNFVPLGVQDDVVMIEQ